jgi:uridine kinase
MLTIGICGASGSGKTTLAEELMKRINKPATLIHQDAYYRDHSHLPMEERKKVNYDHPEVFDHQLLYEDILALREGRSILKKGYDYTQHRRSDPLTPIHPGSVLILEGIHTFYDARVRDLLDFKLFIKVCVRSPFRICCHVV